MLFVFIILSDALQCQDRQKQRGGKGNGPRLQLHSRVPAQQHRGHRVHVEQLKYARRGHGNGNADANNSVTNGGAVKKCELPFSRMTLAHSSSKGQSVQFQSLLAFHS